MSKKNFNLNKRNRYQEEDQFDDEVVEETTKDEIETDDNDEEVNGDEECLGIFSDDTFAKCYVALNTDGEYSCNKLTELVTKANKLGFQGVKLGNLTIKIDE